MSGGPFPEQVVRNALDLHFQSTNERESMNDIIYKLRVKKLCRSLGVGSLQELESKALDSDFVRNMFLHPHSKQTGKTDKDLPTQLVEAFLICANSYSASKKSTWEQHLKKTGNSMMYLPTNPTFKDFLDVYFESEKTNSFLKAGQKKQINQRTERKLLQNKAGAAEENAAQINQLSAEGTVWHAVRGPGKVMWPVVRAIATVYSLRNEQCRWMNGSERGVFGETPLHIALLFNDPSDDVERLFFELWDLCPLLREAVYSEPLYHGENVLHIAIIKKIGLRAIEAIASAPEGPALLEQRADGDFFTAAEHSDGTCQYLGEYPLFFAACTNQPAVFDLLARYNPSRLRWRTSTGENLLHLMVLNAFLPADVDSAAGSTKSGQDEAAACDRVIRAVCERLGVSFATAGNEGAVVPPNGPDVEEMYMAMYNHIEQVIVDYESLGRSAFNEMKKEVNEDGFTPLKLAAAHGSLRFFNYVFEKEVGFGSARRSGF